MVKKISENEFSKVKEAEMALIDFSAVWCGPCKMLAPVLNEVSEEMKDSISIYNIDVDENPELAQQFGIMSIPALVLLNAGEKVAMQVGFQPKDSIINFIKSHL